MQARQHHGKPLAVVMAVVFTVFAPRALEYAVAFQIAVIVFVAHAAGVFFAGFGKFVGIDKAVGAGVVGRVDVNHLHAAGVGFLQDFQGFEVFRLDKQIARAVKIHRFGAAGGKGVESRRLQRAVGIGFARPVELVTLVLMREIVRAEDEFEFFPVDLVFAKGFGEEGFEL